MSQRHPGARRRAHKEEHDPDDLFIAKTLEFTGWAKHNQQLLTVAAIALVLGIAGFLYYRSFRETQAQVAGNQLEAIHQTIALGDREGAKNELATYLQRFGGSPYEGEARMLLGELYLVTGEPQQALAVLEPLAGSPRAPLELQAAALLGAAYEQERRWDDAERVYMRIADRSDLDFQVHDALADAARIRAAQGDTAGAIELYERILADLDENDQARGEYEMRVAELGRG